MKICTHVLKEDCARGPHIFVVRLLEALKKRGVKVVKGDSDILFLSWGNEDNLRRTYKHRKIVVRCDGLYFISDKGEKFVRSRNAEIKKRWEVADGLIYQSAYCQRMYRSIFGKNDKALCDIIVNGTNVSFCREDRQPSVVCSAEWRASKRPNIVLEVAKRLPSVNFYVVGSGFPETKLKNVKVIGPVHPNEVAKYLCIGKVFLHTGWQDPCPNSVVEALAGGSVLVASNSGGIPDIVKKCNSDVFLYRENRGETFSEVFPQEVSTVSFDEVSEDIIKALRPSAISRKCQDLSIDVVAGEYLNFFEKVLSQR